MVHFAAQELWGARQVWLGASLHAGAPRPAAMRVQGRNAEAIAGEVGKAGEKHFRPAAITLLHQLLPVCVLRLCPKQVAPDPEARLRHPPQQHIRGPNLHREGRRQLPRHGHRLHRARRQHRAPRARAQTVDRPHSHNVGLARFEARNRERWLRGLDGLHRLAVLPKTKLIVQQVRAAISQRLSPCHCKRVLCLLSQGDIRGWRWWDTHDLDEERLAQRGQRCLPIL
mmetsp:Transcript_87770/g.209742  ORF Transcript_87770/g.209742 Transcript_87770/m.209742 type:complete len:227 (-) Transcript_87770:14-694(-)